MAKRNWLAEDEDKCGLAHKRAKVCSHPPFCRCLVCWTMSPDWTHVDPEPSKRRGMQVQSYGSNPNGMFVWCDECHGEIG